MIWQVYCQLKPKVRNYNYQNFGVSLGDVNILESPRYILNLIQVVHYLHIFASAAFAVNIRLRQEDALSPIIFNIALKSVIKEVLQNELMGLNLR